jgi:S1-C subfamily serine protease
LQSGRVWQHPSEVGLATRGRVDRRRSTLIASGVVLGGVGLLLSGLVMGSMDDPASATTSTMPMERADRSVALVMAGDGERSTPVTGLVIDDEGHLLVDARSLGADDELWAQCAGGDMQLASVMARDEQTDLAVLQVESPGGVPVSVASGVPSAGAALRLVRAGTNANTEVALSATETPDSRVGQLINLTDTSTPEHFTVAPDADLPASGTSLAGGMVFDRSGRLAGVATQDPGASGGGTFRVMSATEAIGVAEQLLGDRR